MKTNIGKKFAFPTKYGAEGMTYRDYLIGQALAGFCASNSDISGITPIKTLLGIVDNLLATIEQEEIELEEKRQREKSEDLPI